MYTREEASRIRQAFWIGFGQYMKPVPSASGEKVNWSNYKTGIPHLYFRMAAERKFASIAIELTNPSAGIRLQQYDMLQQMSVILHQALEEEWTWLRETTDENGNTLCRIYSELTDVSVFRESDWPSVISFLKRRMMALDVFWTEVKPVFETA
ncbi:DUF4268 domain-containing protein [Sediminibacterium soli]|uniref:DUF4268 domain-containing protein n=1 Tax=Sediminibacterium soli TaxID=2698829 RepID=UPI001379D8D3|nr:DUF4268 domain-containing protein [Sediminibacterium soli]NCI48278.1 DUF4268 domain-containing protein [Sediminibacterium soli]